MHFDVRTQYYYSVYFTINLSINHWFSGVDMYAVMIVVASTILMMLLIIFHRMQ